LNFLLDYGVDINICTSKLGAPLAVAASRFTSRDIAVSLLRRGANILCNLEKGPGFFVLHVAQEILNIFLEGPQQFSVARVVAETSLRKFAPEVVNSKDNKGFTALHSAAEHCDLGVVKLLVGLGCDIGALDNDGNSAFSGDS
jgi:hypothetical protein